MRKEGGGGVKNDNISVWILYGCGPHLLLSIPYIKQLKETLKCNSKSSSKSYSHVPFEGFPGLEIMNKNQCSAQT